MENKMKKMVSCGAMFVGVLLLFFIGNSKDPLMDCPVSSYEPENYEYWASRQYYVIASYPISIFPYFSMDDDSYMVMDYTVEKLDEEGYFRTVYDSATGLNPLSQELVVEPDYTSQLYVEITLQPLVDIYGDGEYRLLMQGRNTTNGDFKIASRSYYVVSGEHLTRKDTFSEVFPITAEDLRNLEIVNGQANFDLTQEEKDAFIDFILNTKLASVNENQRRSIVMALAGGINYGRNYTLRLNIPDGESSYIYSMTGKDLDGNTYQAVFVSGDTAVCLDSEETLLYMLDEIKQKGALKSE